MSIIKGLHFGAQGGIDQAMTSTFGSVIKGTGGFVSNSFKGATGAKISLANRGVLGAVTGTIGYGVGTTARVAATPAAYGAKKLFSAGTPRGTSGFIAHNSKGLHSSAETILGAMSKTVGDEYAEMGVGLAGRVIKPGYAWGLTGAALAVGVANGASKFDYNVGLKTLANGIMDTEGVSITPGSVNASYTPIYSRGKRINNRGASGDLGFALHNSRNTGQF